MEVSTSNHTKLNGSSRYGISESRDITIGKGSWIGAHKAIVIGENVGKGSKVAVNFVPNKQVEDDLLYGGMRVMVIKTF